MGTSPRPSGSGIFRIAIFLLSTLLFLHLFTNHAQGGHFLRMKLMLKTKKNVTSTRENKHEVASVSTTPFDSSTAEHVEVSDSSENIPFLPPGCDYAEWSIDYNKTYDVCVVGAGLSGTTFAERSANLLNESVLVIDVRNHIGGNCYDFLDHKTGVLRNQYGSHLFHTKIKRVWDYVNANPNVPDWHPWYHQKFGLVNGSLYDGMVNNSVYVPIPVNILTVNRLFGTHIQTEDEMNDFLQSVQIPCRADGCQNAEEMAKSRVGQALYEAIFETYTIKQWNRLPKDMDASVTARIPVRSNFDPRYFADKWQALPSEGYTAWFKGMLQHPLIDVVLGTDFFDHQSHLQGQACKTIVYTGPIDRYFASKGLEKLEYRSIAFTEERHFNTPGYVLPTPVVNYPGPEVPYTRAIEYKHYLHRPSQHSVVVKEITTDEGEPYYPVPNQRNRALYEKYKQMADELEREENFILVGRLANYKYFDMDKAINNALELFDQQAWAKLFKGKHFHRYRSSIDRKIVEYQAKREQERAQSSGPSACTHPFWEGEFGMELRVMIPWAYYKSLHECPYLKTTGVVGTKYLYWFSDEHWLVRGKSRRSKHLPDGNPFQSQTVHIPDIPENTAWQAPPFRALFTRPEVLRHLQHKPLVVIQNKYNMEWGKPPRNFFSLELLHDMLDYLTPKYSVLYKRHTSRELEERHHKGERLDLGEKEMIRREYASVVLYEDLQRELTDIEDQNLLMFGVMSCASHFLSVQGGTAVVSSYFGGTNTILIKGGAERNNGDYGYFHKFSNASIASTNTDDSFLELMKKTM